MGFFNKNQRRNTDFFDISEDDHIHIPRSKNSRIKAQEHLVITFNGKKLDPKDLPKETYEQLQHEGRLPVEKGKEPPPSSHNWNCASKKRRKKK